MCAIWGWWVELARRAGAPGSRACDVFVLCFEKGVLTRYTGDILAFSPPLIIEEAQIDEILQSRERWKKVEPILLGNRGCY